MMKTFPAKKIKNLRKRAEKAARLPDDVPSGWSKSLVDPMGVLLVFKSLRIKEGVVLRAYQFREGGNGNGFVFAMPIDAEFPNPDECPRLEDVFLEPPIPSQALNDVMEAIEGKGTPWSYMSASLVARELAGFGAMWHGCDWSEHSIIDTNPWDDNEDIKKDDLTEFLSHCDQWKWLQPQPTEWMPQVVQKGDQVTVTFLSYSQIGREAIYQHVDVYQVGSYKFDSKTDRLAEGTMSKIF